jgi:hypothetical protein
VNKGNDVREVAKACQASSFLYRLCADLGRYLLFKRVNVGNVKGHLQKYRKREFLQTCNADSGNLFDKCMSQYGYDESGENTA